MFLINPLSQGVILTGAMLEVLTCGEGGASELNKILLVPDRQQSVLQAYSSVVCGGGESQRSERFREMSKELREQINTQSVIEKVHQSYPAITFTLYLILIRGH